MPHSIFLGRPLPAPGEPLWLDDDAEKALALLRHRRAFCPDCGEDRRDWLDADGNELRHPPKEIARILCPACEIIEDDRADEDSPQRGIKRGFRWRPWHLWGSASDPD